MLQLNRQAKTGEIDYRFPFCRPSFFSRLVLCGWVILALLPTLEMFGGGDLWVYSPFFCPFHAATGIPCPGCGMTRAFFALAEFKLYDAFLLNPFSLPLFIFFIIQAGPRGDRIDLFLGKKRFYPVSLFVILVWWAIFRLLPAIGLLGQ